MSLLTIVRNFCNRVNLPSPATVYGSTDSQIVQHFGQARAVDGHGKAGRNFAIAEDSFHEARVALGGVAKQVAERGARRLDFGESARGFAELRGDEEGRHRRLILAIRP